MHVTPNSRWKNKDGYMYIHTYTHTHFYFLTIPHSILYVLIKKCRLSRRKRALDRYVEKLNSLKSPVLMTHTPKKLSTKQTLHFYIPSAHFVEWSAPEGLRFTRESGVCFQWRVTRKADAGPGTNERLPRRCSPAWGPRRFPLGSAGADPA